MRDNTNRKLIQIATFTFNIDKIKFNHKSAEKLRGYILNKFKDQIEYHNHLNDFEFNYQSPLLQYKVVNGKLTVIAMDYMVEIFKRDIKAIKEINIAGKIFSNFNITCSEELFEVKIADELFSYEFTNHWIALNEENYKKYKNNEFDLSKQVRNNMIEFFSSIKLFAAEKVMVKGKFEPEKITFKDTEIIGFKGEFTTNVILPEFIGLGKRKSIGYGTIKYV